MIVIAVLGTIGNFLKDSREISKMKSLQFACKLTLGRFKDAARCLCLDDWQFYNIAYLTPRGLTNNLVEMAMDKMRAEGFKQLIECNGKPVDPDILLNAKREECLREQIIHNALDCLKNKFGLKFERNYIFKLATRRMGKTPTEPLRGFPATVEPVKA
jgi:hypothetical protein